jgi:hypothetical protein
MVDPKMGEVLGTMVDPRRVDPTGEEVEGYPVGLAVWGRYPGWDPGV